MTRQLNTTILKRHMEVMAFMLQGPPRSIKDISDLLIADTDDHARTYAALLTEMGLIRKTTPIQRLQHGRTITIDCYEPIKTLQPRVELGLPSPEKLIDQGLRLANEQNDPTRQNFVGRAPGGYIKHI